jgi:hypothetical protein
VKNGSLRDGGSKRHTLTVAVMVLPREFQLVVYLCSVILTNLPQVSLLRGHPDDSVIVSVCFWGYITGIQKAGVTR